MKKMVFSLSLFIAASDCLFVFLLHEKGKLCKGTLPDRFRNIVLDSILFQAYVDDCRGVGRQCKIAPCLNYQKKDDQQNLKLMLHQIFQYYFHAV